MNYKKIVVTSLFTLGLVTLGGSTVNAEDAATKMVNPDGKVLVGYWHSWQSSGADGYKRGTSATMNLSSVPEGYNVVDVSFMKAQSDGSIPTFKPNGMTDQQFRAEVAKLNEQGRTVLIALGGADAHIELTKADEDAFVKEIIRLVDVYGFDGLDIDLEQSAIQAGDNQTVIPAALKTVKEHYQKENKHFMITMAPEFPYLTESGSYVPYIKGLEGSYDFINPQFYNQGGDGFWSNELNMWVSQSNDQQKEEFLYGLTKRLVTGTDGWVKIPANKFVIGIPANDDAAATGYVKDPKAVENAMNRLDKEGLGIKGLMTWSANWDSGKNADGQSYNNAFVKTYAPMLFDGETTAPEEDKEAPTAPASLHTLHVTEHSVDLMWTPSSDNMGVKEYEIFRDGKKIGTSISATYDDTKLDADTTYHYTVKAIDTAGNVSAASNELKVTTHKVTETNPKPDKPTELKAMNITDQSTHLTWNKVDNTDITEYIIYRDGDQIATTDSHSFEDTGLKASTTYNYRVAAVGKDGQISDKSAILEVKTKDAETSGEHENWDDNKVYNTGDIVSYNGNVYEAKWWTQGDKPDQSDVWAKQ